MATRGVDRARLRRSRLGRGTRRLSIVVALLLALTVAVPPGSVPAGGHLSISWLWSWLRTAPANAKDTPPGGPAQGRGPNGEPGHSATAADTRGAGGVGKPADIVDNTPAKLAKLIANQKAVANKPKRGYDPATSKLTARSGTNVEVYQNADGTLTRRTYSGPVNYQAADKSWKAIDTTLIRGADGQLGMGANSVKIGLAGHSASFGRDANGVATPNLATLTLPTGESVAYGLDGAVAVEPVVSGGDATYPNVLPGTDLRLTATPTGFANHLVLRSVDAPSTWLYPLRLNGLTAQLDADGSIGLYDAKGNRKAWIPAGGMVDSAQTGSGEGVHSSAVTYALVSTASGPALRVDADPTWLHDPARVFPVTVDPTAISGTSGDVYVDNDSGTTSSDQNGDNLAVGTYNGGTTKSKAFVQFGAFSSAVPGFRITGATLKLFLSWAYSCTTYRPFSVSTINSAWTVPNLATKSLSDSAVPGYASPPIGTFTETTPGTACTNTAGTRSVGKWEAVPLKPDVFNNWVLDPSTNFGLAITASDTDSFGWKRFTSANYGTSGAYKPYLELTYSQLAPQVDGQYPDSGFQSGTLRPELVANAHDPDGFPNPIRYQFEVYNSDADMIAQSTPSAAPTWVVPAGVLEWGKVYAWTVKVTDGSSTSTSQSVNRLTTAVPQPDDTAGLAQNGDQGFDPSSGNYTMSATDASITTVGPSLSIDRAYNSDDPRAGDAFGAGWSSLADVKATEQLDVDGSVKTVVVTYPNGQDVAFGRNANGTFAPPQGRFATFSSVTGGYKLVDKDGATYQFTHATGVTGQYGITSIADAQQRTETLTWTGGRISDIVSASGRALHLTWSTPAGASAAHVATVVTDQAVAGDPASTQTWQYSFSGDLLTGVCPPTNATHCTTYSYATTSPYARALNNLGPRNYWRLGDGSAATAAADAVLANEGANNGALANVALGQAAFLPGSTATTAGFNGASSAVTVNPTVPYGAGNQTVSLWFKTSTAGGVLLGQSVDAVTQASTTNQYQPVLYVGGDGKLVGQFATAPATGPLGAVTGAGSGRCIDVVGPATTNGTRVHLWDCQGGTSQQWTFTAAGELRVTVGTTVRCLDAAGYGTTDGTAVQTWDCTGADNQKWALTSDGQIVGVQSGKCVDASNYGTASGTLLALWTCLSPRQGNQTWFPTAHRSTTSSGPVVTDGQWHNAVLTSNSATQTLYLDGVAVGTLPAATGDAGQQKTTIGAGFLGGGWPDQSHSSSLTNAGTASFFTGSIAEVASFDRPLTTAEVAALNSAGRRAVRPLASLVRPSGNTSATVTYDTVSGDVATVTDANGGTWQVNQPTYSGSSQVYASGVLAGQPADYWRLGESGTADAVNQVHGNQATYNGVALNQSGGLFSDQPAATFSGTSYLSLPAVDIAGNGTLSASLWFNTTQPGVLLSDQSALLGSGQAPGGPMLWVAADGSLRGLAPSTEPTGPVSNRVINRCMDDLLGSTTNGTKVVVADCNGGSTQAWTLKSDGTVRFQNKCLDLTGYGTANGTKVQLWDCGGTTNQQWEPYLNTLRNPVSGRCLDDPSGSATFPTQFQLYDCNTGTGQQWTQSLASTASVTDGAWHHAVLTSAGSSQSLYLDGNVVASSSGATLGLPTQPYAYAGAGDTAGSWSGLAPGSSNYFNGKIAELALYRNALSANDIAVQFNARNRAQGAPVRTTTVTDPGGKPIQHIFDLSTGHQVAEVDSLGNRTQYAYDEHGFLASVTDPNGNTTTTDHDARGNVLRSVTCQNQAANKCSTVYFTYLPENTSDPDATSPTPPPNLTNDLLVTVRDGRSANATDATYLTTYGYDAVGNRISETDPLGRATTATYSTTSTVAFDSGTTPAGLPLTTTSPGGAVQTQYYNHSGDLAKTVDPVGMVTTFSYDGLGRVLSRTVTTNTFPAGLTTSYSYDKLNRQVTQTSPTSTDRVTGAPHTSLATTVYDYDGLVTAESVADTTGGDATRAISTVYNSQGLPQSTTDAAGKTTTFTYDLYGNVATETDADGGVIESVHDSEGRLLSTKLRNFTGNPDNPSPPVDLLVTSRAYDPVGRLASETDSMGWKTTYTYTDNDLALTVTRSDPTTGASFVQRSNTYDAAGNIVSQVTNNGATTTAYTVDAANRTKDVTLDPSGVNRKTTYTYSPDDFVLTTTRTGVGGTVSSVEATYDAAGHALTNTVHTGTANLVTTYTVDQAGSVTAVTDARGNTTNYSIDEAGRTVVTAAPAVQTEIGDGAAPVSTRPVSYVGFNTFGEAVESKDANGNVTVVGYDAAGRPVSSTLPAYTPPGSTTPLTPTTSRTYTVLGQLATSTDAAGNVTTYSYDQLGNVSKRVTPNTTGTTATTLFSYDTLGDVRVVTDPTGALTSTTYDYLGRKLTETASSRQTGEDYTTTYTYGVGGWLSTIVTPDGVTTKSTYNNLGEPVTAEDGVHNVTSTQYDGAGRVTRSTLADNSYQTVSYDQAGRPLSAANYNPAGTVLKSTSTTYDANGNTLTATDARGTTTTFAYDATNLLTSQVEPINGSDSITSTFGYDSEGNQTRFTDGRGNSFYSRYNVWGLAESQIEPATVAYGNLADRTFTTSYDIAGRVATQTSPGGVSVTNSYDPAGRLTGQTGTGAEVATTARSFGYDLAGRLTSASAPGGTETFDYDDRSLLTSMAGPAGTASFSYTGNGMLATRTDAAGTTNYTYDGAGRVSEISNPTAGLTVDYNQYNALNQPTRISYGTSGDIRLLGYDPLHRLATDEVTTPGGASLAKITYGYDANGNETSKTTTGFTGAASNTYTYDLADRLESWNNGTTTTAYAYDKSGNRVQAGSRLFVYDKRNQLTNDGSRTYNYTARGTLSSTVTGATPVNTQTDAFGQVINQGTGSATQTYNYDALGRVIRTGFAYSGAGNDLAGDGTATYVRDGDNALIGVRAGGVSKLAWTDLHTDVVGQFTPTGTGLSGSTSYDPLGRVLATAGTIGSLGYQSGWTDTSTGRVNMAARWYNTDTGQFDTRDTVNVSASPDSVGANQFAYGEDNPLIATDPTGHCWVCGKLKSAAKAVASTVNTVVASTISIVSYISPSVASWMSAAWTAVKAVATAVVNTVKKVVASARKWVADKYAKAKAFVKNAVSKAVQAGKKQAAAVARTANKVAGGIKDAYNDAAAWAKKHENEIITTGIGIAVDLACMAAFSVITGGAGTLLAPTLCGGISGAISSAVGKFLECHDGQKKEGEDCSIGGYLKEILVGAIGGSVGGITGAVGGKLAAVIVKKGLGLLARVGVGAIAGAITGALSGGIAGAATAAAQYGMTCGDKCSWGGLGNATWGGAKTGAETGAVGGAVGGGLGGIGKPKKPKADPADDGAETGAPSKKPTERNEEADTGGSCPLTHSFAPDTQVKMADGSVRPIKDVNVGDKVQATDPTTGVGTTQPVTMLHLNIDTDLIDVTVTLHATNAHSGPAPPESGTEQADQTVTLHTTTHHPFWDETSGAWVEAADLIPGHRLRTDPGAIATVTEVQSVVGSAHMRDLTVANIHTYYVVAGNEPVLVHNQNLQCKTRASAGGDTFSSGWTAKLPRGTTARVHPSIVLDATEEIGHPRRPDWRDHGVDGQYDASHAERQAAVAHPGKPIEVDRAMCDDCIDWFKAFAKNKGIRQVVTDPTGTNIFEPDGSWRQEH